jgi:hypothetical protein
MNDVDILKEMKAKGIKVDEALFILAMALCKLATATEIPKDDMLLAIGNTYDVVEKLLEKIKEKKACH